MDTEPGSTSLLLQFALIIVLTAINAFFASAEMAIVAMNKNRIKHLADDGHEKAIKLQKLVEEPTRFLSTIQVGITLAGFFSSAFAATGLSDDLGAYLSRFGLPYSKGIALVIVTLILSYFTLVFGELYPKRLALRKPEQIALFAVNPILFVLRLAAPFVKLLSLSTNLLLRLSGIKTDQMEELVSREELRTLVEVSQEQGAINLTERAMIDSIFEFDDKQAQEIMIPRTEVYMIDVAEPLSDYIQEMLDSKHSKIPAYEDDIDNIIGVLYIKDFFDAAYRVGFEQVDVRSLLRKAYIASEKIATDDLFKEMQSKRKPIALLIDEYGGFSGILTLEDLIEEVMGDFDDVYDPIDNSEIRAQGDGSYLVRGETTVRDFNKHFGTSFDDHSRDFDTVAGMLIDLLGKIPSEHEAMTVISDEGDFTVVEFKNNRILMVRYFPPIL